MDYVFKDRSNEAEELRRQRMEREIWNQEGFADA
jgi:hypothetical protein